MLQVHRGGAPPGSRYEGARAGGQVGGRAGGRGGGQQICPSIRAVLSASYTAVAPQREVPPAALQRLRQEREHPQGAGLWDGPLRPRVPVHAAAASSVHYPFAFALLEGPYVGGGGARIPVGCGRLVSMPEVHLHINLQWRRLVRTLAVAGQGTALLCGTGCCGPKLLPVSTRSEGAGGSAVRGPSPAGGPRKDTDARSD